MYAAAEALAAERFDIVYTGLGALNWLPDLPAWARVVRELLANDGFLYLSEFHPMSWVLGDDDLTVVSDYFHEPSGERLNDAGTYADLGAKTTHDETLEWAHSLADVIGAVLGAGLRVELFNEHDYTLFPRWPFLEEHPGAIYRLPEGSPRLPLMFSLRARRD